MIAELALVASSVMIGSFVMVEMAGLVAVSHLAARAAPVAIDAVVQNPVAAVLAVDLEAAAGHCAVANEPARSKTVRFGRGPMQEKVGACCASTSTSPSPFLADALPSHAWLHLPPYLPPILS